MSRSPRASRRSREVLAGALVTVALVHVLQLPATAAGSMTFLSGELTFGPFGRSDPALAGTDAAQRIEMRPNVAGRERLSVYIALRRIGPRDLALDPTSALSSNVVRAVSRVPLVPADPTTTWRSAGQIDEACSDVSLGIDAQLRYRFIMPRRSIVEQGPFRPPSLVAFHRSGEEWIVERSCLDAR